MTKAFSLIELIFAIAIISIIAIVSLPKLGSSLDKTNLIKIKSDVAMIRESLYQYRDKQILQNQNILMDNLEQGNEVLFDKILQYPILNSSVAKSGNWSKISNSKYNVWITSEVGLEFDYDSSTFSFDCDFRDKYCEELTQ